MSRRIRQDGVWTLEATETYDENNPADSPVSWGSTADVEAMNQAMSATTGGVTHLGALLTFDPDLPDIFNGVYVKVRPTYTAPEAPAIEMWTHNAVTGDWTKKRRVVMSNLLVGVRSGEFKVFSLFQSFGDDNIDQVWITMAPSSPLGTQELEFFVIWPYGTCNETLVIPDDCLPEEECDLPPLPDLPGVPSCRDIARLLGIDPSICDQTPPLTCDEIAALFGLDPNEVCHGDIGCIAIARSLGLDPELLCGGGVTCEDIAGALGLDPTIVCVDGRIDCTQVAFALGLDPQEMCQADPPFPPTDPANPLGVEPCTGGGVYIDPETLEPAADPDCDAPSEIQSPTWNKVYENWFVYTDKPSAAANVRAQKLPSYIEKELRDIPNERTFYRAMQTARNYLIAEAFNVCANAPDNTRDINFYFHGLVEGMVITVTVETFKTTTFLTRTVPRWLRDLRNGNFPPDNVAGFKNVPLCGGGGIDPQLVFGRNFTLTPQIDKYSGDAIEPESFHILRGVTEDPSFDFLQLRPLRFGLAAGNPLSAPDGSCIPSPYTGPRGQAFNEGFSFLVRFTVYTPVVDGEPLVSGTDVSIKTTIDNTHSTTFPENTAFDVCWP